MRNLMNILDGYDPRREHEYDAKVTQLYGRAHDLHRDLQALPLSSSNQRMLEDSMGAVMTYLRGVIEHTTKNLYPAPPGRRRMR